MSIAINDKNLKDGKGKYFKTCRVVLRKGFECDLPSKINISELINPGVVTTKKEVLCYCDGYRGSSLDLNPIPTSTITVIAKKDLKEGEIVFADTVEIFPNGTKEDHLEELHTNILNEVTRIIEESKPKPIEIDQNISVAETFKHTIDEQASEFITLDGVFHKLDPLHAYDKPEDDERNYQSEKVYWVMKFSHDKRLKLAVKESYLCDDEYVKARMLTELPEFEIVDHKTFIYPCTYPTYEAMVCEQSYRTKMHENKKQRAVTRIGLLEEHSGQTLVNPIEVLIIFNYLNKVDIFAPISSIVETAVDILDHEPSPKDEE